MPTTHRHVPTSSHPDPACFDINGKPIFDSADPALYGLQERPLSDQEMAKWKTFQLHKTVSRMERRDMTVESLMRSDAVSYRIGHRVMGTPFPIIEPSPIFREVVHGTRWYENMTSVLIGLGRYYWLLSKPLTAGPNLGNGTRVLGALMSTVMVECLFFYRSMSRLVGNSPNEHECVKFGVIETPERLKEKAERWAKYAAYKKEWVKRWNYNVWGMRPGEEFSLFTSCIVPYLPVRYNTRFDYPMRKNPFHLTGEAPRDFKTLPNRVLGRDSTMYEFEGNRDAHQKHIPSVVAQAIPEERARYWGGPG